MLDGSKNVFLAANCEEHYSLDKALKVLSGHGIPQERIKGIIDIEQIQSGDYLISCLDDKIEAWEVQFPLQGGFTARLVCNL